MAIELSKDELLKTIPSAVSSGASVGGTNKFSQVMELINNPMVQQILLRLVGRIPFMQGQQQDNVNNPVASNPVSTPATDKINFMIEFLSRLPEDMTNKVIKEELNKYKEGLGK